MITPSTQASIASDADFIISTYASDLDFKIWIEHKLAAKYEDINIEFLNDYVIFHPQRWLIHNLYDRKSK